MEVPNILNFKIIVLGHQGNPNDKQVWESPLLSRDTSRGSFFKATMSPLESNTQLR